MPTWKSKLHNVTTGVSNNEFTFQDYTVTSDALSIGNDFEIVLTSKSKAFDPMTARGTIDSLRTASVSFIITERGAVKATLASSLNSKNILLLFGPSGVYTGHADIGSTGTATFKGLLPGTYTAIAMGRSELLGMVSSLDDLHNAGLSEGDDYIAASATVNDGVTTDVNLGEAPLLDESKFYYTTSNTSVSSNKSRTVPGTYVTVTANLEFKPDFLQKISNIELVTELADECDFIYNSSIIGSKPAQSAIEGNTVVIPIGSDEVGQRVRYCFIPTCSGEFLTHSYLRFNYDGTMVTQPLGRMALEVEELGINAPWVTTTPEFYVTGTTIPNSMIEVFDGSNQIGLGYANENGLWKVPCTFHEPINLSKHKIHADITMAGGVVVRTGTCTVQYDFQGNCPTNVDMIYRNKNYSFNFIDPPTADVKYTFVPSEPNFTFKVNFIDNSPERVSNVKLNVLTTSGSVTTLNATYIPENDSWVATGKFNTSSLPTNISVNFDDIHPDPIQTDTEYDRAFNIINNLCDAFRQYNILSTEIDAYIENLLNKDEITSEDLDAFFKLYGTSTENSLPSTASYQKVRTLSNEEFDGSLSFEEMLKKVLSYDKDTALEDVIKEAIDIDKAIEAQFDEIGQLISKLGGLLTEEYAEGHYDIGYGNSLTISKDFSKEYTTEQKNEQLTVVPVKSKSKGLTYVAMTANIIAFTFMDPHISLTWNLSSRNTHDNISTTDIKEEYSKFSAVLSTYSGLLTSMESTYLKLSKEYAPKRSEVNKQLYRTYLSRYDHIKNKFCSSRTK